MTSNTFKNLGLPDFVTFSQNILGVNHVIYYKSKN